MKVLKKLLYIIVSLLCCLILSFIPVIKGFFPSLVIQALINIFLLIFSFKEKLKLHFSSQNMSYLFILLCYGFVSSYLELSLSRNMWKHNWFNSIIVLLIFCIICFTFLNDKVYVYLKQQKPFLNLIFDLLTSILFVCIAFFSQNLQGEWAIVVPMSVSLVIYILFQKLFLKKKFFENILGDFASYFILVYLLLLIAEIYSKGSPSVNFVTSFAIYLFFLPIRLCITDKMKIRQKDKKLLITILSTLIILVVPLTAIMLKDASGKGQGLLGLALLIWGIPKLLNFCQDKVFSYLDLKDKNGSDFKINKNKDTIVSMVSIGLCLILFTLSLEPIVLNPSSKDSISVKFAIAYRVLNSVSIGTIVTTMIVGLSILLYSKKDRIHEKMKFLLDCINTVAVVNICSIILIIGLVYVVSFLGKTYLNSKEFLELYKWSLLILVPMILKALPLLINTLSNGKLDSFPEGSVYSHFRNVVELNLFCLFFMLYLLIYFCNFDLTDCFVAFLTVVIVTDIVIHILIFDLLANKIGEKNNS